MRAGGDGFRRGGGDDRLSPSGGMRSWPAGRLDLLIRSALSPIPQARQAWRSWTAARRFEDITWQEMRLLGTVSARLPELDPHSPLRPRIDGILKNRWVLAQLKLRDTRDAFERLRGAGVSFIVFKGGAFQAEGLSSANRRVLGDIDVLVRPGDALPALDALHGGGWEATNGESVEYLRRLATVRLNGNFRKGHHGNVDLHVSPFHYSRDDASLDESLWSRARPALLGSAPVLVPDPTDSMLIVLAHATESANGDWTVDVATRIREQSIDWDRLVEMAGRRGIVPACLAGLSYLSLRIGVALPDTVTARLASLDVPFAQRLKYWSNVRDRAERGVSEKIGNRLADLMLERQGFSVVVKDRTAITVTRSTVAPLALARTGRTSLVAPPGRGLQHEVRLPDPGGRSRLVVRLTFANPVRSRRLFFDVCVDGVAVARLRTRAGGGAGSGDVGRTFRFSLPAPAGDAVSLRISARPAHFLRPDATAAEIEDFGPHPFDVAGVWAD
jgi:hypothetical protein